jgi:transcription initiation factor TFIIB
VTALEASDPIAERSAYLFRRVAERGLLVGHSLEAMAAACVHATARETGMPFPLKQVAANSPVDQSDIRSAFGKLLREFDIQIAPPLPTDFIPRFASDADLSNEVRERANQIARVLIEDEVHVGQSPTGVAAAVLYGAAKEWGQPVTQEELATIAYVSVVTLSRQWQRVQDAVSVDLS